MGKGFQKYFGWSAWWGGCWGLFLSCGSIASAMWEQVAGWGSIPKPGPWLPHPFHQASATLPQWGGCWGLHSPAGRLGGVAAENKQENLELNLGTHETGIVMPWYCAQEKGLGKKGLQGQNSKPAQFKKKGKYVNKAD